MILWEEWGRRLREARKAAGLSQMELAARCHLSQPRISAWELGRGAPRDKTKLDLAEALGLAVSDLFPFPGENAA